MHVLSLLTDPNAWAALLTLTVLEIVLGIDNLVFISVLTTRLDDDKARRARQIGLSLAFIFRVIMLAAPHLAHRPHGAAVYRLRHGNFLARHHPDRRRTVPDRQGDA